MQNYHRLTLNLVILTILLTLSSCCIPCGKAAPKIGKLEEVSFTLRELNLKNVEDSGVSIRFDAVEKIFYGGAPCNNFFGGYHLYEAKGTDRNIEFFNIGGTQKACSGTDTSIERGFVKLLPSVKRVMFSDDNMLMINSDEEIVAVLVFEDKK